LGIGKGLGYPEATLSWEIRKHVLFGRRCCQSEAPCARGDDLCAAECPAISGALRLNRESIAKHCSVDGRLFARAQALERPDRHSPLARRRR
jgi:hypothetical protein